MKKLFKYSILLFTSILVSCSDFLDEKPRTFLSPETYFKNYEELNTALNELYRAPQDRYSRNWAGPCWFEWATDIMEITEKNTHQHHNEVGRLPSTFNASSSIPDDIWRTFFKYVKDANYILKSLETADVSEKERELVEGQTRALRASVYFDAVRIFESVPLLLETNTDIDFLKKASRANATDIYDAIIKDLEYAMGKLPDKWDNSSDLGRITSGGAAGMLAKVYLTMSGFPLNQTDKLEKSRVILENFIEKKTYGTHYKLMPKYSQVFDHGTGPAEEGVWIINFMRSSFWQGSLYHTEFAPLELYYAEGLGLTWGGGWSNGIPTQKFYDSYDKVKDERFIFSYWNSTSDIPEEYDAIVPKKEDGSPAHIDFYRPHIKKFREKTPNDYSQGSTLEHSVIRYADMLLMYAEVLNEQGNDKCYDYINLVRDRAGLDDLPTMSKDDFKKHLMLERAWELCFEGDRKFDLVRWGNYVSRSKEWNPQIVDNIKENKHEFWPVPQSQRDISVNLSQNNGW